MGAQPASVGAYDFTDMGRTVRVEIDVHSNASELDIRSTGDSLTVSDKPTSRTLLSVLQLYSTVDANATQSSVSGGSLTITLTKLENTSWWPALEAKSEVLSDQQGVSEAQTSRAMEERDKVKALLSAAQAGSVSDLQVAAHHFEGQHLGDIKDATGKNALHFAAQLGQQDVCQYLITEQHVSPDTQDEAGARMSSLKLPCLYATAHRDAAAYSIPSFPAGTSL